MSTATQETVIRLATLEDLPGVVDAIVALREETIWKHVAFEPNRPHILTWLMHTLSTQPNHALYVAVTETGVVGIAGGELVTEYFVPDVLVLHEWGWWVDRAHRGRGLAWRLWTALMD